MAVPATCVRASLLCPNRILTFSLAFQRKTGYVQQQDLHLSTSTVREALTFSALLRQPSDIPREEKIAYVDEVIKLLEMEEYAEAVVGVPGEGLNVEQRKRLTIGVELVAKPSLLLVRFFEFLLLSANDVFLVLRRTYQWS